MEILTEFDGGIVIFVLATISISLFWLFTLRRANSAKKKQTIDRANEPPETEINESKNQYSDDISEATLVCVGGSDWIRFRNLDSVKDDDDDDGITLFSGETETNLYLGAYDLLVCTGKPEACEFKETAHVRILAAGQFIFDQHLAGVTHSRKSVTGYDENGKDVSLFLGSSLTLILI